MRGINVGSKNGPTLRKIESIVSGVGVVGNSLRDPYGTLTTLKMNGGVGDAGWGVEFISKIR